jgi:hypothetical protein
MADEVAKEAAPIFHLTLAIPSPSITQAFCLQEKKRLLELRSPKTPEGKWI